MADGGPWNWAALSQPAPGAAASTAKPGAKPSARPEAKTEAKPEAKPNAKRAEDVEAFSGLRLACRALPAAELAAEMRGRRFVALADVDRVPRETFTDEQLDWVTIGALARKTLSKPTAAGSTFMVWGVADLAGAELGVFLFDEAYDAHWQQPEGAVVALLNAALLPATERNKFAFKVTRAAEVVVLGTAADFGICKGTSAADARCRLAVNTARSQYCLHHIAANFAKAGRGRQQLNNSLGNIRKALFTTANQPKNISAGVYTSAAAARGGQTGHWNPLAASTASRKRPRDGAGVLGVPTVLSATGSVVQRAPPAGHSRSSSVSDAGSNSAARQSGGSLAVGASAPAPLPPRRVSRGEKIISLLRPGSGGPAPKRAKTKKVDMIRFMSSGAKP